VFISYLKIERSIAINERIAAPIDTKVIIALMDKECTAIYIATEMMKKVKIVVK